MSLINYCKNQHVSRTFLPKIFAQNQGCSLSAGTSAIGCLLSGDIS